MSEHETITADVVVIGAGPAGLTAALALAQLGLAVVIAAPRLTKAELARDTRTFAALGGSVDFLMALGVWSALEPQTAPLRGIRLIDNRGSLLRAPEVLFQASDAGLAQFGANIPQAALSAVLTAQVDRTAAIRWCETRAVASVAPRDDGVTVVTSEGCAIEARLVAASDGRNSIGRRAAGIGHKAWQYPQTAVTTVFGHSREHDGISTEFHGPAGPLTTVPMPDGPDGPRSRLVWVERPERADAIAALDDAAFLAALARGLQGLLGSVRQVGVRSAFPLSGLEAETMARARIALVGEAGHVLPPIGAQGLNLGLRDAATLADCVQDALSAHGDIGAAAVTDAYASARSRDVWARTQAIDLLNRSLLTSALPAEALRGLGLHALSASPTLRRLAIRQGLEPVGERPRLMRPAPEMAPLVGR